VINFRFVVFIAFFGVVTVYNLSVWIPAISVLFDIDIDNVFAAIVIMSAKNTTDLLAGTEFLTLVPIHYTWFIVLIIPLFHGLFIPFIRP